jgi:hypothetical protein
MRGWVRVHDWWDRGPIMWPCGLKEGRSPGRPALILCGDLMNAVRREAAIAVARHWSVSCQVVRRWRRALGVERITEGTRQLFIEDGNMEIGRYASTGARASLRPEARQARDRKHAATLKAKPDIRRHMKALNARRKCPICGKYRIVGSGIRGPDGRFIPRVATPKHPARFYRTRASWSRRMCADCYAAMVAAEVEGRRPLFRRAHSPEFIPREETD